VPGKICNKFVSPAPANHAADCDQSRAAKRAAAACFAPPTKTDSRRITRLTIDSSRSPSDRIKNDNDGFRHTWRHYRRWILARELFREISQGAFGVLQEDHRQNFSRIFAISINVAFYADLERKTRRVLHAGLTNSPRMINARRRSMNVNNRRELTRSDAPVNFSFRFSRERKNARSVFCFIFVGSSRKAIFSRLDSLNRASRRKAVYKSAICHAVADNRESPSANLHASSELNRVLICSADG